MTLQEQIEAVNRLITLRVLKNSHNAEEVVALRAILKTLRSLEPTAATVRGETQ